MLNKGIGWNVEVLVSAVGFGIGNKFINPSAECFEASLLSSRLFSVGINHVFLLTKAPLYDLRGKAEYS